MIIRFLTILTIIASLTMTAQAISLSQRIDKGTVAFEDSLTFEIEVQWTGNQAAYRFERALDPYFDRLKVGRFSSSISSKITDGQEVTSKKYKYTLIPTSSGAGKIDAITINYIAWPDSIPGELITEPLAITIATAKPVVPEKSGPTIIWIIIIGLIIVVPGSLFGIWKMREMKRNRVPVLSPKDKFLSTLEEIKKEAGTDFKQFQFGLHAALGIYFESAFAIKAEGQNEEEIRSALQAGLISDGNATQLADWYLTAGKDKFRPVNSSPGDTVRLENEIRNLFSKI